MKGIKFEYKPKKLVITSITASQLPLFAVPEHTPHPVCEKEQLGRLDFLIAKLCLYLFNLNVSYKICSFEVHNVDVAKKSTAWQGPQRGTI